VKNLRTAEATELEKHCRTRYAWYLRRNTV